LGGKRRDQSRAKDKNANDNAIDNAIDNGSIKVKINQINILLNKKHPNIS
jgi:hypothetical protein